MRQEPVDHAERFVQPVRADEREHGEDGDAFLPEMTRKNKTLQRVHAVFERVRSGDAGRGQVDQVPVVDESVPGEFGVLFEDVGAVPVACLF